MILRGVVPRRTSLPFDWEVSANAQSTDTLEGAAAPIRKAGHRPNGGDGANRQELGGAVWLARRIVAGSEVAGSSPAPAPTPKPGIAQLQESAGRPASEDSSTSGSTARGLGGQAVQPASISRRRVA